LNFFTVYNAAIHVDVSEIEALPNRFIALLNSNNKEQLYFIEKFQSDFLFTFLPMIPSNIP
jgi:hypothetical protein